MDPFVTDLIRTVRQAPSFNKAFIGGGSVRDFQFGKQFRDIDIFVPVTSQSVFHDIIYTGLNDRADIPLHSPYFPDSRKSKKYFGGRHNFFLGVAEFKILGMEVDVIGVNVKDIKTQEEIMNEVLSMFNIDINKVAYDGFNTLKTDEFTKDFQNKTATLSILDSLDELPKQVVKLNSLNIRLGLRPVFDNVLTLTKTPEVAKATSKKSKEDRAMFGVLV
jgi:hypothetical protein